MQHVSCVERRPRRVLPSRGERSVACCTPRCERIACGGTGVRDVPSAARSAYVRSDACERMGRGLVRSRARRTRSTVRRRDEALRRELPLARRRASGARVGRCAHGMLRLSRRSAGQSLRRPLHVVSSRGGRDRRLARAAAHARERQGRSRRRQRKVRRMSRTRRQPLAFERRAPGACAADRLEGGPLRDVPRRPRARRPSSLRQGGRHRPPCRSLHARRKPRLVRSHDAYVRGDVLPCGKGSDRALAAMGGWAGRERVRRMSLDAAAAAASGGHDLHGIDVSRGRSCRPRRRRRRSPVSQSRNT